MQRGDFEPALAGTGDFQSLSEATAFQAVEYSLGQVDEALPLYQRELVIVREDEGAYAPEVAARLQAIGRIKRDARCFEEARVALDESLSIYERAQGRRSAEVAIVLSTRGQLFAMQDDLDAAERDFVEALGIRRETDPDNADGIALLQDRLAAVRKKGTPAQ